MDVSYLTALPVARCCSRPCRFLCDGQEPWRPSELLATETTALEHGKCWYMETHAAQECWTRTCWLVPIGKRCQNLQGMISSALVMLVWSAGCSACRSEGFCSLSNALARDGCYLSTFNDSDLLLLIALKLLMILQRAWEGSIVPDVPWMIPWCA